MILALLRRDSAVRFLGRWLAVGPLVALTMMGVLAYGAVPGRGPARGEVGTLFLTVLTLWLPAAIYLAVNAAERRCSRLDMELPISARVVWTARTLSLLYVVIMMLAATAGVVSVVAWSVNLWAGLFPRAFGTDTLLLVLRVLPALVLGVALAQCVAPELERLPRGGRLFLATSAAFVLLYLLSFALAILPFWVGLVPLALAVAMGVRAYRSLGGTVLIAAREPSRLDGGRSRARSAYDAREWPRAVGGGGLPRLWNLVSVVYRSTTKMPVAPAVGLPILLAAGFTMAGAFGGALRGDDSIRFSMLFIISYCLLSFSGLPPRRLFLLDALPLSRRFVFAVLFIPYVLMVGIGYAGGRIVADRAENARELVRLVEMDGHYYLTAPLRYGAIALDGEPRPVTAPWGESHEVWSVPMWSGATPVVHARFSTPPGSSADFVAWQLSRAVREIYSAEVPWEELRERYLTSDGRGRVVPRDGALTLASDHPEWRVTPYGPVFPMMMLFVCGLWFAAMSFYLRTLRPGFTERGRKGAFWAGMVVLMGLHLSQFAAIFTEHLDHWILSGTSMIAIRALSVRMPGGSLGVWISCAVALYAVYWMAERRFVRVESKPGDDIRVALIERPIGAAAEEGGYAR